MRTLVVGIQTPPAPAAAYPMRKEQMILRLQEANATGMTFRFFFQIFRLPASLSTGTGQSELRYKRRSNFSGNALLFCTNGL